MPHPGRIVSIVLTAWLAFSFAGCATANHDGTHHAARRHQAPPSPIDKVTTFLMFEGKAEEAMRFYTSLFHDSGIV